MLNTMLEKQASQIKTAADQFRMLSRELDKLAFTPDPTRKVEGMDALLAVRDYNSPVYKRHRDKPGAVDELLGEDALHTVARVANLPSEVQEPPMAAEHGDDSRKSAVENKALGTVGMTWDPKAPVKTVPRLVADALPGTGGAAKPQPNIPKSASRRTSIQQAIAKLAAQGRIRTLENWR